MSRLTRIGCVLASTVGLLFAQAGTPAEARGAKTWVVGAASAGCADPHTGDVREAIDRAVAGDTIRLCAGIYPAPVTVSKTLTIEGPLPPLSVEQCLAVAASDPTTQAVLTGGVIVAADGATVRGLVVEGAASGIATTAAHPGYRITGNLVRNAGDLGIEVESNGALPSRVDHNCVRDKTGGAIVSEDGPLRAVRIDANTTSRNNESVTALGEYTHDQIVIDGNSSVGDRFGIAITSSTRSAITRNRIDGQRLTTPATTYKGWCSTVAEATSSTNAGTLNC